MTQTKTAAGPPALPARLSPQQIQRRIKLNQELHYGLEGATSAQLNVIYQLSRRWNLDPVTDLTLYRGVPWVKDQGWYRIIRRHPDFRGIDTHPLTPEDKELWGYPKDDIVIECAIETANHGVIKARGRATRQEINESLQRSSSGGKQASPIGIWDVEIAEKRAIARCGKLAFGQDMPDEGDVQREVEEEMARRNNPTLIREDAQKYADIYEGYYDLPEAEPAAALPAEAPAAPAEEPEQPWERNKRLQAEAYRLDIRVPELAVTATAEQVLARNAHLEQLIADRGAAR